jgi:hypothetical protein
MIVLDEFQFIARQEPEIGSLLNRFVAEHAGNPDLLLCISGSDVSFFERSVVGYGATSYGRRTGSLRLRPFPWSEIHPFVEGWSVEDRIRAWAVFGGVPHYLKEIDPRASLADAIRRAVLYPDGLLREEPRFLLSQESRLRDTDTYMSCLRAIAGGATRLNQIAQRIGRARSEEARPFLETLEEMGVVARRHPLPGASRRKVHYAIVDPFLRFWFRFVAPRESRLQLRADADRYLEGAVLPQLDKFVSEDAFERICQDWLLRHLDPAVETGRWWGSIRRREQGELRSRPTRPTSSRSTRAARPSPWARASGPTAPPWTTSTRPVSSTSWRRSAPSWGRRGRTSTSSTASPFRRACANWRPSARTSTWSSPRISPRARRHHDAKMPACARRFL